MAAKAKDLTGQTFGELIALRPLDEHNHNCTIMWECECKACGAIIKRASTKLRNSEVKSCGCLEHKRSVRTPKGLSGLNALLSSYKSAARSRGLDWELTKEQFKELTIQDCTYCGIEPKQIKVGSIGAAKEHGKYIYNGVDRVDNTEGYTLANCVPCCEICNKAKRNLTQEEFTEWVIRLIGNFIN